MKNFNLTEIICAAPPQANPFSTFLPLILMMVIFYFILIRPQRKKQKALEAQIKSLQKGDQVVTIGGMHGTIGLIKDRTITLKINDNTRAEFDKSAVARVISRKENNSPIKGEVIENKKK